MDFHGTPTELLNLGIDFSEFLRVNVKDKTATDVEGDRDKKQDPLEKEVCMNEDDEEEVAQLEDVSKGKSQFAVFRSYFRSGANYYALASVLFMFILTQLLASGYDYWMSFW